MTGISCACVYVGTQEECECQSPLHLSDLLLRLVPGSLGSQPSDEPGQPALVGFVPHLHLGGGDHGGECSQSKPGGVPDQESLAAGRDAHMYWESS